MTDHKSAEDYLERILMLAETGEPVHAVDIANSFGYSKPSVSIALMKLEKRGMVLVNDRHQLSLTAAGKAIAQKIYERHKVLGALFVALGVTKDVAFDDACRVEHDISDETFEALKKHYQEKVQKGEGK
ncbi:MAG: metal-dependent transcriptional regulator [Bacilli bacterium]|jgi:Mn-dependent DtxR family transcriptional regulator|nr:metal-dependent transcriptional regulator [Bacilli bacterium]